MAWASFWCVSLRGDEGEGEKRIGCLSRLHTHTERMKKRERKQQLCRGLVSKVYINNARSVLEAGTPLWRLRYDRYLVVDGHAAGGVFLEDLGHPVGEPLILQLGLLLAVLLLVGESTCEMYSCCSTFGQGIHYNNKVSLFFAPLPPHTRKCSLKAMDKTLQEVGPNMQNVKVKALKISVTQLKGPSVEVLTTSVAPWFVSQQHCFK